MTMNMNEYTKYMSMLNYLKQLIEEEIFLDPYVGMRIAEYRFKKPYLCCANYEVIALAVMRLLMKYAYNTGSSFGKFTIGYITKIPTGKGNVSYSIGKAISIYYKSGKPVPKAIYESVLKLVIQKTEDYDKEVLFLDYIKMKNKYNCV